ncbi:hypothetical protein JYT20_01290 [Rhodothermus sp. AH-315-K08]|nr:hypothetical protein [Rhodothermus sp. AH-315-K08]
MALAAMVGTISNCTYEPGKPAYVVKSLPPGCVGDLLADLAKNKKPVEASLWREMLLPVILQRTEYQSHRDIDKAWDEVSAVAGLLGIDAAPILAQAAKDIREPKSWAKG